MSNTKIHCHKKRLRTENRLQTRKLVPPSRFTLLRIRYYATKITWGDQFHRFKNALNPFRNLGKCECKCKRDIAKPCNHYEIRQFQPTEKVSTSSGGKNKKKACRGGRRRRWLPSDADDEESEVEPGELRTKSQHEFKRAQNTTRMVEQSSLRKRRSSRTRRRSPPYEENVSATKLRTTMCSGDIKMSNMDIAPTMSIAEKDVPVTTGDLEGTLVNVRYLESI